MSIGVVTTVGTYEEFLPGWCQSVRNLRRQPDRIVIAAHHPEKVHRILKAEHLTAAVIPVKEEFMLSRYLNKAISHCHTDWISWIGVDDRYRPCALDGLDNLTGEADVFIYGMQLADGRQWLGGELDQAIEYNPVPCGSPFRRWIWEKLPFQPELFPFEDWAFWVGAQHLNAKPVRSGRIDFDYAQHPNQRVPPLEPTATKIRKWAASL